MRKATLLCVTLLASGCVGTADCDWAKPIRPTEADVAAMSSGLARDLLTHNETGQKLCGW